jgi:Ricin-type beta-trefoil lectin domain
MKNPMRTTDVVLALSIAGVLAGAAGLADAPVWAQQSWNLNQQATDACEQELTLRMGSEANARDPHAVLDSRGLNFRQQGNNLAIRGTGSFRRDRFDNGRTFTFDCGVDTRNGNTQANYRWSGGTWGGGYDDPGYSAPPAYRPPPSGGWGGSGNSGGASYPPTGRVFYSGGIVNRASGKGLDVQERSTRDAANVQQWDFGGSPNQSWDVIDQGNGVFSIISQGSGKALDIANHDAADGANAQQFRFHNGDNQLWRLQRVGGGFYQIISVSSGKCLDVNAANLTDNGANVQQWSCSGQPNQQWKLGNR